MKLILLYFLFPLITWQTCRSNKAVPLEQVKSIEIQKDGIDFVSQVLPILVKNVLLVISLVERCMKKCHLIRTQRSSITKLEF